MSDEAGSVQQRLRSDVEALCARGPRPVGSDAHDHAREYLTRRVSDIGLEPYSGGGFELPYAERFVNIVGIVDGGSTEPPLVLGAHYDTVPTTPGADDNAAAVAIALEVAARLLARPAARSVVLAIFDAEEPPYFLSAYMGSHVFVRDQLVGPVDTAVIMDLVGHAIAVPGLHDAVAVMGSESHPDLAATVESVADAHLPVITLPNDYMPDMSDHAAFRHAGLPFLFLSCGHWEHYHQPTDVPPVLDYAKMARITDLVEALIRELAARPALRRAEPHDTSALDYQSLARVIGEQTLAAMGVRGPMDVHMGLTQLVRTVRWS